MKIGSMHVCCADMDVHCTSISAQYILHGPYSVLKFLMHSDISGSINTIQYLSLSPALRTTILHATVLNAMVVIT